MRQRIETATYNDSRVLDTIQASCTQEPSKFIDIARIESSNTNFDIAAITMAMSSTKPIVLESLNNRRIASDAMHHMVGPRNRLLWASSLGLLCRSTEHHHIVGEVAFNHLDQPKRVVVEDQLVDYFLPSEIVKYSSDVERVDRIFGATTSLKFVLVLTDNSKFASV
ncbi:hypothetical protein U1Q18_049986 [Sarracenia purpurea var. burkii]